MAHTYNPSYSGGGEDHGLRPTLGKS
jgi:hypothetical protein